MKPLSRCLHASSCSVSHATIPYPCFCLNSLTGKSTWAANSSQLSHRLFQAQAGRMVCVRFITMPELSLSAVGCDEICGFVVMRLLAEKLHSDGAGRRSRMATKKRSKCLPSSSARCPTRTAIPCRTLQPYRACRCLPGN